MSDFDERSGIVQCTTRWGCWWQTTEEVVIEISVPEGTLAKDIKCTFNPRSIQVSIKGNNILNGSLSGAVLASDALWTFEDKKLVRICLEKVNKTAGNVWKSLLDGQYEADPFVYDKMQQKMTLERFQLENPGMDFSGATISGNYQGGGPQWKTQ